MYCIPLLYALGRLFATELYTPLPALRSVSYIPGALFCIMLYKFPIPGTDLIFAFTPSGPSHLPALFKAMIVPAPAPSSPTPPITGQNQLLLVTLFTKPPPPPPPPPVLVDWYPYCLRRLLYISSSFSGMFFI